MSEHLGLQRQQGPDLLQVAQARESGILGNESITDTNVPFPELAPVVQAAQQQPAEPVFDVTTDQIMESRQDAGIDSLDAGNQRVLNLMNKFSPENIPAIEQLRREDIFPGLDQPINVGSVQGQVIGTQPIFVGSGGVFPVAVAQARRRALGEAAKKKSKLKKKILDLTFAKGAVQTQDQLDRLGFRTFERWAAKTNNNFETLIDPSNPMSLEFLKEVQGLRTLGAETIELDAAADQILKDAVNKEKFVPESVIKNAMDFNAGRLDLEEFVKDPQAFAKMRDGMRSYQNMVNVVRSEVLPQLKEDISFIEDSMTEDDINVIMNTDDYDVIRDTLKKYVPQTRIDQLAGITKDNFDLFQEKEEVGEFIANMLGQELQVSTKIAGKFNLAAREALQRSGAKIKKEEIPQTVSTTFRNRALSPITSTKLINVLEDKTLDAKQIQTQLNAVFTEQSGLTSIDDRKMQGVFDLSPKVLGESFTETYQNLQFHDKASNKWLPYDQYRKRISERRPEDRTVQEQNLLDNTSRESDAAVAVTKYTGEWQHTNNEGDLQIIDNRNLVKNPEIASDITPTHTIHYRLEGLPKAIRTFDLTKLGTPSSIDDLIGSGPQTQFRFQQKQGGATGLEEGGGETFDFTK